MKIAVTTIFASGISATVLFPAPPLLIQPAASGLSRGSECVYTQQCTYPLSCLNGKCYGSRKAGEPCQMNPDSCTENNYCNNGMCSPLKGPKSTCSSSSECQKGLICNIKGECALPKEAVRETFHPIDSICRVWSAWMTRNVEETLFVT